MIKADSPAAPIGVSSSPLLLMAWIILIICLGSRTFLLIQPKDLWIDELYIWDILHNESIATLFSGEYASSAKAQSAPLLFLLLNKTIICIFGDSLLALYILPYFFSCLSLWLVWHISAKIDPAYQFSSIFIFSLCLIPLYYTTEFKQYGWELFASLALLYSALKNLTSPKFGPQILFCTSNLWLYIFCILISTPALLYIAALLIAQGCLLLFKKPFTKEKLFKRIFAILQTNTFHLAIFLLFVTSYYYFYLSHTNSAHMKNYWAPYLIPLNPSEFWPYLKSIAIPIFVKGLFWPIPFGYTLLASFVAGCAICWKIDRKLFWLLSSPILITLLANFKFYPPGQPDAPHGARLLLFLAPNILLMASWPVKISLDLIQKKLPVKANYKIRNLVLILCVSASIVWNFSYLYKKEYFCEQTIELFNIIKSNYREGDKIFIGAQTTLAYQYAQAQLGPMPPVSILGIDREDYLKSILNCDSKGTIFVLFTHYSRDKNFLEKSLMVDLRVARQNVIMIPATGSLLFIVQYKNEARHLS